MLAVVVVVVVVVLAGTHQPERHLGRTLRLKVRLDR